MLEVTLHRRPPHCCVIFSLAFFSVVSREQLGKWWNLGIGCSFSIRYGKLCITESLLLLTARGPSQAPWPSVVVSLPAFWGDSAALESWNEQEENLTLFYIYLFKIEKCSGTSVRFHSNLGLIKKKRSVFLSHVVNILIILFASWGHGMIVFQLRVWFISIFSVSHLAAVKQNVFSFLSFCLSWCFTF